MSEGRPGRKETSEEALQGGAVTVVVRVGDTIRRRPSENSPFVHRLLEHFATAGWAGAPRVFGFDELGREILTYLPGFVDWDRSRATPHGDASLEEVARLVRTFHDLTAGTHFAGAAEVVCHNDLAPRNTVYRSMAEPRGVLGFIDWDLAAPGRRVEDVAHMCWQFIELGPEHPNADEAGRRIRLMADAYGLGAARADLIDTILFWQDRCWRGIEDKARAGDEAMIALRDRGAAGDVRASFAWTHAHRDLFQSAL
jgi:hypothetical protein